MAVNELLFAAFQRPLPYPAAKMKLSQGTPDATVEPASAESPFARPKML
jgi:hypothetical protein